MAQSWWVPPRLHKGEGREKSWLELFYDLVYVAILIQLGNRLSNDVSLTGVATFVALFIPIWWSWTGVTFYVNRFVVDDIPHRLLIFTQIFFIALLGTTLDEAFGKEDQIFTISYVAIRVVLILLYARTHRHAPEGWPLIRRYVTGFSLAASIWLLSLALPQPWNWTLWGVAMIVDFATPLNRKSRRLQQLLPPDNEHMTSRYGIFTIIVLGEAFVKVISYATEISFGSYHILPSIFGLVVVAALWWIYFDDVADAQVTSADERRGSTYIWLYSHLPLAIAITTFGVAIKKLVLHPVDDLPPEKYRWLASGAVALALAFVAIIDTVTDRHDAVSGKARARYDLRAAAFILLLPLLGGSLILYLGLLALLSISPIVVDIIALRASTSGEG